MERRKYEMRKRAEGVAETRRRIVDAALALHTTVGPARTTVADIARRAGVERVTVYNHFPTERDIFAACGQKWFVLYAPPDPSRWREVRDPRERLRRALADVYGYFRSREPELALFYRDLPLKGDLRAVSGPYFELWDAAVDVLMRGFGARGRRRERLRAALRVILLFETWRSLTSESGLSDEDAVELGVRLVRGALDRRSITAPGRGPRRASGAASGSDERSA